MVLSISPSIDGRQRLLTGCDFAFGQGCHRRSPRFGQENSIQFCQLIATMKPRSADEPIAFS